MEAGKPLGTDVPIENLAAFVETLPEISASFYSTR